MDSRLRIVVAAVAALVLSGGGFVAGMTVGPALGKGDTPAATQAVTAGGIARRSGAPVAGAGAFAGVQQVSGRVISVNDGSITIEVRQPGSDATRSVIALVGGAARVVRTSETDVTLADIKPGDQILVVGQPDAATGTVSASAVVIGVNALQQLFGGSGAGGPGPSGSPGFRRPAPSPSATP